MQHSALVKKEITLPIFCYTTEQEPIFEMWKLSDDSSFTKIDDIWVVLNLGNGYYRTSIQTPNEDCFLCIKFGDFPVVVRVGTPVIRVVCYNNNPDTTINFKQINPLDGSLFGSGTLMKLSDGFYYKNIPNESLSIIEIEDDETKNINSLVLKLPYIIIDQEPTILGHTAKENFLEVGTNMFGFLGGEKTKFDLVLGEWIQSSTFTKAADLAKSIAFKYNLEWTRTVPSGDEVTQPKFIGNYVKYIKSQDEVNGRALTYKPYATPEANANNFEVVGYDRRGNQKVKGLTILLDQMLETLGDGGKGAILPFTND